MQRERVQQHLPRARFLISGLGTLGCFLISNPQPSHPEPPRANVFPCQVKCHPRKTVAGVRGELKIITSHGQAPTNCAAPRCAPAPDGPGILMRWRMPSASARHQLQRGREIPGAQFVFA